MSKLKVLDLFSGIGGFSLGLERTGGFETVAFCEIDPYCRRVLAKHWPEVPIYEDVRELTGARLAADGIAVDVICGGFPCQDISFAGKRAGLEGERSGLWSEYGRLIGELRPSYVIVENVPGLLSLGMGTVLGDLSSLRYDAVWDCIPASAVGAPHRRDRVWLVAYAGRGLIQSERNSSELHGAASTIEGEGEERERLRAHLGHRGQDDSDAATMHGTEVIWGEQIRNCQCSQNMADTNGTGLSINKRSSKTKGSSGNRAFNSRRGADGGNNNWRSEPDVGRVAHGVPSRVDRLRSLGNAVVPQIPELIGKAILESMNQSTSQLDQ